MPTIAFPAEMKAGEKRCSLLPVNVKAYKLLGADVLIESGLGQHIHVTDEEYIEAGASVSSTRDELLAQGDIVLSLHKLSEDDVAHVKQDALVVSYLDPFNEPNFVDTLCSKGLTSISMEMIPRISRCQKMDALSSQASLAGYVMVMQAVNTLANVLPMMMTPAGTLKPAKVFIIGAGVAGLQAIATAKRLGASVTAFDTRTVVAEQVRSLGAKFLDIDLGETGETGQGYAQALTPEQMQIQQREQAKCIADSDIVITTAQLFGRKPPVLIKQDTIASMRPGSVIVDMAAETGGNVEGSVSGETVTIHGVNVIGTGAWANGVAKHATQMYASNLYNLISEFWSKDDNRFALDIEDEVQSGCIITYQGKVVNKMISDFYAAQKQTTNDGVA
ncbi:NAD(P) transhydrogenase subunit alpha [Paraglaciecola chathamensis]|jgi:NAD(P) transhydrogenase subunit alpha|uniref:proton-translocating NAD(P)(+) transhydrogenase n=3 Tax=Paraglaciecola chathamensis TaxID=368405 RepID=A0A8H9I9P0_9ALTE|nr:MULTISPECIES: NAD(P) transhydrogenase subunit alpha [Paraglaciecola]AEE24580.1 alanine dehydrogenase/PNT domain protein [Glaciecola sp. 4H-3-7+YE-5]GAC03158.1 NAD(P) transhydrogenase subunit alpha [Paraglaciecola agarilytica NO2]GAC08594.1 NAD(P) transhydrogenase subunit alpha [Paraglaciecola chathamensis S18K6]GGZ48980.1 NAD(P) transhydrogenase subunit alpha [Paraglaciecola oceanifecundans]